MADKTGISWTNSTWNIITGCSLVSPGCQSCYAMRLAGTRLKHTHAYQGLTKATPKGPVWNGKVRFNENLLDLPIRWRKPRRIFVNSMGDLFHEDVPDSWIDQVFLVMAVSPRHTFQVLTKRPQRMRAYCSSNETIGRLTPMLAEVLQPASAQCRHKQDGLKGFILPNVWIGVSVEDQKRADERIPILLDAPAAVRWISAEPLLGPLNLARFVGVDWVVAGGESGPGARPMDPEWVRSIRDQCVASGVPFHFKQWGEFGPIPDMKFEGSTGIGRIRYAEVWNPDIVHRIGKKKAGRILDGRTWDEYPE